MMDILAHSLKVCSAA